MAVPDVIYTSNPVRDYEFSWTIENLSLTQDVLRGPSISPIPGFPANLRLQLNFKQVCDSPCDESYGPSHSSTLDVVLIDLNVKTSKCSRLTLSGSTWFEDTNGESVNGSRYIDIECTNFKGNFTLLHYTSRQLFSPITKQAISLYDLKLLDDKLVVKSKLRFSGYNTATSISSLSVKGNSEASGELLKDLKTMYESGSSSDITFSVGENTLPAHKLILLSRSPVFAKMFESDMSESNSNNVVIEDADVHAFNCFLMFLYTGIVEDKKRDTVLSLYSLAHKYQVNSLHAICSGILGNSLTIDTACSVLVLSDLHADQELKHVAKGFIRRHLIQLVGTTEWVELVTTKPQLMKEVLA